MYFLNLQLELSKKNKTKNDRIMMNSEGKRYLHGSSKLVAQCHIVSLMNSFKHVLFSTSLSRDGKKWWVLDNFYIFFF